MTTVSTPGIWSIPLEIHWRYSDVMCVYKYGPWYNWTKHRWTVYSLWWFYTNWFWLIVSLGWLSSIYSAMTLCSMFMWSGIREIWYFPNPFINLVFHLFSNLVFILDRFNYFISQNWQNKWNYEVKYFLKKKSSSAQTYGSYQVKMSLYENACTMNIYHPCCL